MPLVQAASLFQICLDILQAVGVSEEESCTVAECLVQANLKGIDSHGVRNLPRYVRAIQTGRIVPGAEILVEKDTPTTAVWDVNNAFGFVAAKEAVGAAVIKAEKHFFGAVATYNSLAGDDHIGALGIWAEKAAEKGMVGFVVSTRSPRVAAWGGTRKVLGINPMAVSVPSGDQGPITLDISMGPVSRGHLHVMMQRGEKVPEGWILDPQGRPTTDPSDFFQEEEGVILPFGGHKGYGLAVVLEALVGGLGSGCSSRTKGYGHFYAALNINGFVAPVLFREQVEGLIRDLKISPTQPGVDQVYYPGEKEHITKRQRTTQGIPLDEIFWQNLIDTTEELGLKTPSIS